jgi:hypothetical protein
MHFSNYIYLKNFDKNSYFFSRVIDAHAASYSDNHVHFHHPPPASIDLIAYAWMSPNHDLLSLPTAFSIQFGVNTFVYLLEF